jgi:allantoinase
MSEPIAIRSKRVLIGSERELRPATLLIQDEKIVRITEYGGAAPGARLIDVGKQVVMPGIVDTHAHINEPGRTEWEGFQTATRAAAAGGITTVIDMPLNSIPATTTLQALRTKARSAEGQCTIDYGFWGGVVPGNADELEPMVRDGALGFKTFLIESGVDEFTMSREADLRLAMPILARLGVPLLVHAELDDGCVPQGRAASREYRDYLESRPQSWETQAIEMMIRLSRETRCRIHIVHLSAADALPLIRQARNEGVPITVETCPHYLFFEAEKITSGATQFKCAPPIREHANREKLWQGLQDGTIDFIVSDHSPCTPQLKRLEVGEFEKAWGGISGIQFSFPVIWTEMKRRGLSVRQVSDWMSARVAEFGGLGSSKGRMAPGMDADLVIWDPDASFTVRSDAVLHKNRLTPYEGNELFGKVTQTWVRGQCVYQDGSFPRAASGRQWKGKA